MTNETIKCELCGESTHVVHIHLRDKHGEGSESPCTLEEYKKSFPEAPLLSEMAKKKKAEKDRMKKPEEETSAGEKAPLADLFGLGSIKAAKTRSGKDILVSLSEQDDFEELVCEKDPNYVFNIEVLKTVLMGIDCNMNVYMYGHAGVGKSTLFEQISAATKRRLIRVQHTINTEESHIVGQWGVVDKVVDGQTIAVTEWQPGPLMLAMKHGWMYLADEYDRGHPTVMSVYQAVLEGKALYTKEADQEHRMIKPHKDFRFVATGNTNGSGDETGLYQATITQDAANFERFQLVIEQPYMRKKDEVAIVQGQGGVDKSDAERIVDFAHRVREMYPDEISLTIGPRVAIGIAKIGLRKASFLEGIEYAFANRLPAAQKASCMSAAKRVFTA